MPAPEQVAVVDIDGTLADVRHRLRHVSAAPKDWAAFFAAMSDDGVLEQGAYTVGRLAEVYRVVYLSGRPERFRAETRAWLDRHGLPEGELHLRPAGDFRPSSVLKVQVLDRLSEHAEVVVLVDDDPLVLDAARHAGYDVLPATWMAYLDALHEAQEVDGQT
ncbi:MAG: phosphatase domain-containing protein [Nocardioidaceae bacterium]